MSNTPTEERFRLYRSRFDLDYVNERLLWNPYPPDREARRDALWKRRSESPPPRRMTGIELLDSAMKRAEYFAEQLAKYHEGRVILVVEDLNGWEKKDYEYWMQRSEFYKAEGERLDNEDYNRESRSVTPEKRSIDVYGATELSKARTRARNAAGGLAVLPAGNSLLEADPNYWLDRNEFRKADRDEENHNGLRTPEIQPPHRRGEAKAKGARDRARSAVGVHATLPAVKALLEAEEQREDFTDPAYWRRRETIYRTACDVLPRESALERARRHAYTERKRLATFPAGRALLRNEDHGEFAADPKYWLNREEYYYTEYKKLERKFWDRLRLVRFNREEITLREAMNGAHWGACLLSHYHEGRVILETENPGENEENFEYWLHR